jgi:DNA primase
VASSGTSLTIEQIQLIRRFSENITVLYDGDNAGIKASLRGIDLILTQGLNVKVVIFPDGDDPDSYLKKVGTTVFQKYLQEESQDFITFKANLYQSEARKDPLKRAEMIKEVVQSIIKIPDEIKRRVFFQECSRLLEINEETLIAEGNHLLRQEKPSQRPTFPSQEQIENTSEDTQIALTEEKEEERLSPVYSQEKAILRLLLLYPEFEIESISQKIGQFFYQELKDIQFENTLFKEIFEALCEAQNLSKPFQVSFFIQNSPENWKSFLVDLMTERFELSNQWKDKHNIYIPSEEEVLQQIVQEHVLRLKMNHILKLIQKNGQQLQQAKTESEQIKVMTLGIKLKQILTEIAGHLNNIVLKI